MSLVRRLASLLPAAALAVAGGVLHASSRSRPTSPDQTLPLPPPNLPAGHLVAVPGVGELFVRDTQPAGGPPETTSAAAGQRPVVVLLHGWMFPADVNWFPCYGPLSEVARVLAVDHRGHGRGLRPAAPFRLADVADDVAALLRHLGVGRAVAVGYSMGGPIAQLLWQRHPDVVGGLVLCATAATFNDTLRDRWVWRLMGALQVYLRLIPRASFERLLAAQVAGGRIQVTRMVHPGSPPELLALLPWIISEFDRGSAEDIAEAGRELGRFDARGWLRSVDVPTAVLVTTRDRLVTPDKQRALAGLLPDTVVHELPLDHDAVGAAPDLFGAALRAAVEQVLGASAEAPAGQAAEGA